MRYVYTVVLRPEPESGYTVIVPALPGCLTCGDTIGDALRMGEEAICAYLESLLDDGEPIPDEGPTVSLETENLTEAHVFRVSVILDDAPVAANA